MTPILVTIKNGVVDSATIARNGAHLEQLFMKENADHGRIANSDEVEDGYVELEDVTICMTWASIA